MLSLLVKQLAGCLHGRCRDVSRPPPAGAPSYADSLLQQWCARRIHQLPLSAPPSTTRVRLAHAPPAKVDRQEASHQQCSQRPPQGCAGRMHHLRSRSPLGESPECYCAAAIHVMECGFNAIAVRGCQSHLPWGQSPPTRGRRSSRFPPGTRFSNRFRRRSPLTADRPNKIPIQRPHF